MFQDRPQTALQSKLGMKPSQKKFDDKRPTTAIYGQQFHFTNEPIKENKTLLQDIARKRPKIAKLEEERLTQEQLGLNNQLQDVLLERQQLQDQLKVVETQRERYQKLIYEIEDFVDKKKGIKVGQGESWLVIKLKNQINELNSKIEQREQQIIGLKKNPSYTKRQETSIMIDYLNYFSQHLKNYVTGNQPQTEGQDTGQNSEQLQKLEKEIQEMEINYQQLQEQNENVQIQKTIWDKKVSSQYLVLDKVKEDLKERERDLHYLKSEIKKYDETARLQEQEKHHKTKKEPSLVKKQENINQSLKSLELDDKKAEIIDREQIIGHQEKIINELKERLQERTNQELKSKNELHDELSELKDQVSQMRLNLQELKDYYFNEIQPLETDSLPIIQGNKDHTFTILHDILNKQEKRHLKVPKVQQEEVDDMGKEISLRLQLKQMHLDDALSVLFGDKLTNKGTIMVQDLQEQLLGDPFLIADPQQAQTLARFMVEDNASEIVTLDPEAYQKAAVVKSVFRKLVGCYTLLDSTKDKRLWEEITGFIVKFEAGIRQQFDNIPSAKLGFICPKDLFYVFTFLFIDLTEQQKEYVLLRLFSYTNNIHKLMHMKLFDVFKPGAWIDRISPDTIKKSTVLKKYRNSLFMDDI